MVSYHASAEDAEDASQDARLKLLKVRSEHRNNDVYCKTTIENQLRTSYARHKRTNDPLLSIDPHWDTPDTGDVDTSLNATLESTDEPALDALLSANFVTSALSCLTVEQQLVISLHLGLASDSRPIKDLPTLSRRSFVAESRLPGIIKAALAKLKRWHRSQEPA